VDDGDDHDTVNRACCDFSNFAIIKAAVDVRDDRSSENLHGIGKVDTVLANVGPIF